MLVRRGANAGWLRWQGLQQSKVLGKIRGECELLRVSKQPQRCNPYWRSGTTYASQLALAGG